MEGAGEGYMQQVDMCMVALYAQAYSDWIILSEQLESEGMTLAGEKGYYLNPAYGPYKGAINTMEKAAGKLGFSPYDRGKSKATAKAKDEKDELDML